MTIHPFEPIFHPYSRILILGTMPSVRSREENFYYGHPQNRFWRVISCLTGHAFPESIDAKKELLSCEGIALWDVLRSCDIDQSKDDSIKNPIPNDMSVILSRTKIKAVFTNGKKADELYKKLCSENTGIISHCLPSTSPANSRCTFDKLLWEWSAILKCLN